MKRGCGSDPLVMLALVIVFSLLMVAGIIYVILHSLQGMHA